MSEALTNAAKHSHARLVTVRGGVEGGRLMREVADDGSGGAGDNWGSGLQGLTDRLATLDGSLAVASPRGGGTRRRTTTGGPFAVLAFLRSS